jgi:hypothetical protein
MKKAIEFMNHAIDVTLTEYNVRKIFSTDMEYGAGNYETAMHIFGSKLYQVYPFVFERLPPFFAYFSNASVCFVSDGKIELQ